MKALILGCGPAGLLAAHAVSFADFMEPPVIISVATKSALHGCQYLHRPIPGLTADTVTVNYTLDGTAEDYAAKQYGTAIPAREVSAATLLGEHPAWDLRSTYSQLWDRYSPGIVDHSIDAEELPDIIRHYGANLVINSMPRYVLCREPDEHQFAVVTSWAMGDAPGVQEVPVPVPDNTVLCNGTRDVGWYRASNVFGHRTVEWPGHLRKPPIDGVVQFSKPLRTNCTCSPEVMHVGRYGRWAKNVLSHHAFEAVSGRLRVLGDTPERIAARGLDAGGL